MTLDRHLDSLFDLVDEVEQFASEGDERLLVHTLRNLAHLAGLIADSLAVDDIVDLRVEGTGW